MCAPEQPLPTRGAAHAFREFQEAQIARPAEGFPG